MILKVTIRFSLISILFFISTTEAASYAARTVSRANCLVGLRSLSALLPDYGYTFNESISWDPKFWSGHYMYVTSELTNEQYGQFGLISRRRISMISSGTYNQQISSWRQYASNNMQGDRRVATTTSQNWVYGTHYERLNNSYYVSILGTAAVNCNLTTW